MNSRNISISVVLTACLLCPTIAVGQSGKSEMIIDASVNNKGERVHGPKTIRVININRIRYQVELGTEAAVLQGPSLALPFLPQLPEAKPKEAREKTLSDTMKTLSEDLSKATQNPPPAETQFLAINQALEDMEKNIIVYQVQNHASVALRQTRAAADLTDSLVRASDELLLTGSEEALKLIAEAIKAIETAQGQTWPDEAINEILGSLSALKTALRSISDKKWLVDNRERYDNTNTTIDQLREKLLALSHNDSADGVAAKFDEAQRKLKLWHAIFKVADKARGNFFTHVVEMGCGFAFANGKETKLKMTKRDRLAAADAQPETREILTVECSSPLSVSGGFGFSTLEEQEFALVQSTKPGVDAAGKPTEVLINRFGFKNQSSFRTLPVLLLNTRLWEPNDTYALHASAGAAVDLKGQAGTDVEFIVGPSLSFKRTMFITPGLHVGRVPKLAGGFKLGDEVPSGVSSPPLEKSWRPRFAVSVTFKIR